MHIFYWTEYELLLEAITFVSTHRFEVFYVNGEIENLESLEI